ncbi:MAG: hypothetical protein RLZZ31_1806 [Actinomycetota bacterium]
MLVVIVDLLVNRGPLPRLRNGAPNRQHHFFRSLPRIFCLLLVSVLLVSCAQAEASEGPARKLRVGYLASLTHAPAIIGIEKNFFADALGSTQLSTKAFNSGTEVIEALFSGALDLAFIGPNPALNGFAKSKGKAVVVIAGSTNGGAAFITRKDITTVDDLRGTTLATPSLGNTQDVALRAWLRAQNLSASVTGDGDVEISPRENADTLNAFREGKIDGAWVPEPWATRLVQEGDGHVFVDERSLWPNNEFTTTLLIAHPDFAIHHRPTILAFLNGLHSAIDLANDHPQEAQKLTNDGIAAVTSKKISEKVLAKAWQSLSFSIEPNTSSLEETKNHAVREGFMKDVSLNGFIDLSFLNEARSEWKTP